MPASTNRRAPVSADDDPAVEELVMPPRHDIRAEKGAYFNLSVHGIATIAPITPKQESVESSSRGDRVEWGGVGWSGVEWGGVGWSGVGWSGVGWSGVEWSGVGWCGVEWGGVGWSGWSGVEWGGVG